MKTLLNKWNPISLLLFAWAILFAVIGSLNGFEMKVLNIIIVVGSVVDGLLIQAWIEMKRNDRCR